MKAAWWLALSTIAHERWRSALLVVATALVALLPVAVERLLASIEQAARDRTAASALVIGSAGSRFDLVLSSLWFRGRTPDVLPFREIDRVRADGLAEAVPLHVRNTARGWPLCGTTPQYFARRGLVVAAGELPLLLGECVLGAAVAARDGLRVGDKILSDRRNPLAIDEGDPLRMRIVGIFAPTRTADDHAVFTSLQTAWIVDGLGHGHADAKSARDEQVMRREGALVVLDSSVRAFQEIDASNVDSFHFHADQGELPLTAVLAFPRDDRSATILAARYRVSTDRDAVVPREVVDELLGYVFGLKQVFDLQVALVVGAVALLLVLLVFLTVRLRAGEIRTLHHLGASRGTIVATFAIEFGLLLAVGLLVAAGLAAVVLWSLQSRLPWS
jgi:putative ABC transport system permease protein